MQVPDWSDNELRVVESTTQDRFGKPILIEQATSELRGAQGVFDLYECPALFWEDDNGTHYVISKLDERRYQALFFYPGQQMHRIGAKEYHDIGDSVTQLLLTQASHHAQQIAARKWRSASVSPTTQP